MTDRFRFVEVPVYDEKERGVTTVFELDGFANKRSFCIKDVKPGVVRGSHANLNSKFLLSVINGSCKIKIDDGSNKKEVILNNPNKALFIENMVWKEMSDFSADCVLQVFTDTKYDKNEYIYDYDEYIKTLNLVK